MTPDQTNVALGLLALIAVLLILIAIRLKPNQSRIAAEIDAATASFLSTTKDFFDRIGQEGKHHFRVTEVLDLTKRLHARPELIAELALYGNEVVVSALTLRVNALGSDIEVVQSALSKAERDVTLSSPGAGTKVNRYSARLAELQAQLLAANQVLQQFSGAKV